VTMLHLAKSIVDLNPSLDRDLLNSAIILQDLGKVKQLSGPVSTTYTVEGNLNRHITIMLTEIAKAAEELGNDSEEN
ncbi:3'-5' exonuclease, partial [Bacillus sp. PsM16]|nr:3'-5' exonuclease [Bacillus sp. PsM16]